MMARRWLVTFDVRGTLLRVRGTAGQQYADAASRIGVRVAPDALEQSFLDAYRSIAKQHPNFGHGVVNRAFEGAGASQAIGSRFPALFASLYDGFARHDAWEVYPDVRHVLESLTKDRHVLGVVSNFDERLDAILEGHGLHKYFSFVLASGVFGAGKPDARIYQEALHLAQPLMDGHVHRDARAASPSVLPTDTCGDGLCEDGQWDAPPLIDKHPFTFPALHVGDDRKNDFDGARASAMHALLVKRECQGKGELLAQHEIADLNGVLRYLASREGNHEVLATS